MNSREKGKRGERQWRDELQANGYAARRGQQFSGSADSPDVVCEQLRWIHFEVKAVEKLNVENAIAQAQRDCGGKVPIVAHRRKFRPWLVTMEAETFFRLVRGDFTGASGGDGEPGGRNGSDGKDGRNSKSRMANRRSEGTRISDLASQARLKLDAPDRVTAPRTEVKGPGGPEKETRTVNAAR